MLKIEDLSYSVDLLNGQKKDILKNINLTFEKGKLFVITGPNGSGKSTLAKLIMGLIQPSDGKILFEGKEINNLSITERAKMGFSYALF